MIILTFNTLTISIIKDNQNIKKYLTEDILIFLGERESFIYGLCKEAKLTNSE